VNLHVGYHIGRRLLLRLERRSNIRKVLYHLLGVLRLARTRLSTGNTAHILITSNHTTTINHTSTTGCSHHDHGTGLRSNGCRFHSQLFCFPAHPCTSHLHVHLCLSPTSDVRNYTNAFIFTYYFYMCVCHGHSSKYMTKLSVLCLFHAAHSQPITC